MPGAIRESFTDDDYIATGTHRGATSDTLSSPSDFRSCGIVSGMTILNVSDGSSGTVESCTENTLTTTLTGGTSNTWTAGDVFEIYVTGTIGSEKGYFYVDRRYGHKVTIDDLINGILPEDIDEDEFIEGKGSGMPESDILVVDPEGGNIEI